MPDMSVLDEIVNEIEPEGIPPEYIILARIIDFDGRERVVRGKDIETLMNAEHSGRIAEARIVLDVPKIKQAIINEVNAIYNEIGRTAFRHS